MEGEEYPKAMEPLFRAAETRHTDFCVNANRDYTCSLYRYQTPWDGETGKLPDLLGVMSKEYKRQLEEIPLTKKEQSRHQKE